MRGVLTKRPEQQGHHMTEQMLRRDLQFFDLKQMIEFERQYKGAARSAIVDLKKWRRTYEQETDMVGLLYGSVEGVMLRRRAEDFAKLYWLVRADVRQAMAVYTGRARASVAWNRAA